jgi:hypothetical protein
MVAYAAGWLPWLGGPGGRAANPGQSVASTPRPGTGREVPAAEPHPGRTVAWRPANSVGAVWGTSGPLLRFRVAVEAGVPVEVWDFTKVVDETLGDSRSWIAGGDVRLQRMPWESPYDFTIYLASPDSAYEMCLESGVDIREGGVPYTSCRAGDNVVINSDRYLGAVPDYTASLEDYRHYVINHEVGHRLGYGHVYCPGDGEPAPVMQQQTLGLQGCTANSWPYLDGEQYTGPVAP